MKRLLIFLVLCSGVAMGQSLEQFKPKQQHIYVDGRKSIRPKGFRTIQFVALQFSPVIPKQDNKSHSEIYRAVVSDTSKEYYDRFAKQYSKYYNEKGRRVDVRFVINGVTTDYTFAEFRKILWP